jgi:hypothetical protein
MKTCIQIHIDKVHKTAEVKKEKPAIKPPPEISFFYFLVLPFLDQLMISIANKIRFIIGQ